MTLDRGERWNFGQALHPGSGRKAKLLTSLLPWIRVKGETLDKPFALDQGERRHFWQAVYPGSGWKVKLWTSPSPWIRVKGETSDKPSTLDQGGGWNFGQALHAGSVWKANLGPANTLAPPSTLSQNRPPIPGTPSNPSSLSGIQCGRTLWDGSSLEGCALCRQPPRLFHPLANAMAGQAVTLIFRGR